MTKKILIIFIFSICSIKAAYSQDSLSVKDTAEINYRAGLLVNEFKDLLNIISNSSVDAKDSKDVIFNSYAGHENKIFTDSAVQIEDDINPVSHQSNGLTDLPVSKYLNNLDLFYNKSDTPSITFVDIRLSSIKKADYLYIKVYFNSLFNNKNNLSDSLYSTNSRVAEIKMEKVRNKWVGNIIHVGFYQPSQLLSDTVNDFKSVYNDNKSISIDLNLIDTSQGTVVKKTIDEEIQDKERQKQVDLYKDQQNKYTKLIGDGDAFLKNNDFASASKSFSDAAEIMPYEIYPKLKLNQIRKLAEQATNNSEELYKQFIAKAQLAESFRKYEAAKEFYLNAISQKPEERKNWEEHLKELDNKIRTISVFEDKYNAGRYSDAINDYDKVIKKDGTNSDYFLGRAMCYDKLGVYSKALKDYTKSIDIDNNNLEALRLRADLYKRNNEFFKALEDYKIYLTLDKADIQIYEERSDLHALTNNIKGAVDDLQQGIEISPKVGSLYFKKGQLLEDNLNDHKSAIENFTIATRLEPDSAINYYYRGKCEIKINSIEAASQDFISARNKGLDSSNLKNIETFANTYCESARDYRKKRNFDSAILFYDRAIMINPFADVYRFEKGESYFFKYDFTNSVKYYTESISLNKKYTDAYFKRGVSFFNLKRYSQAISDFDSVVLLNPADYNAERYSGESYYHLQNFKIASAHLENAITLINNIKNYADLQTLAVIYNMLGKSYFELNDYERAYNNLKNSIKNNKDFAEAYYNRGCASFKLNQLNDAANDLLKALSIENHLSWNYVLADIYFEQKNFPSAFTYFSNTINQDSANVFPQSTYYRGYSSYQLKQYPDALKDYLKCISVNLDTAKNFNNELGNIYLNLGSSDSSYIYYFKSYSADSTDGIASYGIASSLFLQNKTDESLPWFEKAFQTKQISYTAIKHDKIIEKIRGNQKFKELINKYYR